MTRDPAEEVTISGNVLGDRIREARQRMNMTQSELAGTDYSVSYISAIERNKIRPSLRALAWLASRLNVSLSDLLATDAPVFGEFSRSAGADVDDVQHTLIQAQMALASRDYKQAHEVLSEIREQVRLPSQRIQVSLLLGETCIALRLGNEAKEVLDHTLVLTHEVDPVAHEQARNLLGRAYNLLQMHMVAIECHRQCLVAIESHIMRDPSFHLSVLYNLGNDYLLLALYADAIATFQQAAELGEQLLSPQSLAQVYWQVSEAYRHDGQISQALRYGDMAAEHLRQAANKQIFARVQSQLGQAFAEQKETKQAESTLQRARDLAERAGDDQALSLVLVTLARTQLARGAKDAALTSAQSALESAQHSGDGEMLGRAYLVLGEVYAATERAEEADKQFVKGLKHMEKAGAQMDPARAYERYADLLEQRGDMKGALEYMRKSRLVTAGR